ncbi:HET-domain-containing protein [Cubamyces sp. BRFM 1775]|nr:HET-domain-containing protein [Cubamyces sp. BRFM 1775]
MPSCLPPQLQLPFMSTLHLFLARFFGLTPHDCPASQKALPPRPPTICKTAWEGVFAKQFGLSCEVLRLDHEKQEWTGGYQYKISSVVLLEECAQSGCLWCLFLAKRFLTRLGAFSHKRPVYSVHIRVGSEYSRGSCLDYMSVIVSGRHGWSSDTFSLCTSEGDPAAACIPHRILIPNVGSPYALALAKTCIETCIRDHPKCRAITSYPIGSAPLPTRLVDCSNPDCLRLIETTASARGTYIALSYVWGDPNPCYRTTLTNLAFYKVRIDTTTLPQTILDAIHVTRALGIGLLWIDGLCIVQDSEKDMHHELARMRDVYRHAFLTIDAGSAAKVSEGFLQDRILDPMPEAVLPFICPPGNPFEQSADGAWVGMVYLVEKWSMISTRPHSISNGKPTSHTASRGWCLQERLLSTRSLVFTTQTLQLRCHTQTHNVGGADHLGFYDVPRLPDTVFHPDRHVVPGSEEWKDIHYRWWEIVEDYTRRKLSKPSDKLVAISALAEMFAPTLGPGYLAGLWRRTLLTDLFWSCDSPCSLSLTECRGPSWSWAYTNSGVSWWDVWETGVPFAEIIRCTVTPQNENLPFGPVTGASLILRSCLLPCKVDLENMKHLEAEFPLLPSPFSFEQTFYFDSDVAITVLRGTRMWFVPVVHYYKLDVLYMRGLVACRAGTDVLHSAGACSQGDVYRRVGLAQLMVSIVAAAQQDSMDPLNESDVYLILSQIPRVDIELV